MRGRWILVMAGLLLGVTMASAEPDWQKHLIFCIGNHTTDPGETNCPDQYAATYPECIAGGGRQCLTGKAIESAKAKNCDNAFRLSLICQCNNGGAQTAISAAGKNAVCNFLAAR